MSKGKWIKQEGTATAETVKVEDTKIEAPAVSVNSTYPDPNVKLIYRDLESRIQEIENFRNPASIEKQIGGIKENIEDIQIKLNVLNSQMIKVLDLLKKSFNFDVNSANKAHEEHAQPKGIPAVKI